MSIAVSALMVYVIFALLVIVALRVLTRRRHTHSELVLGDVKRDMHSIVAAIDGIPKVHVTRVDQLGVIYAKRNLSDITIRVDLRQKEPTTMEVTITVRISGLFGQGGMHRKLVSQVMQAIYSAQERLTHPKPPFGPSPVT
jgi:hypothetical protein